MESKLSSFRSILKIIVMIMLVVLAAITGINALSFASENELAGAQSSQCWDIYLPLMMGRLPNGNAGPDASENGRQSPTSPCPPDPGIETGPLTDPLPNPDAADEIEPQDGRCPAGMHLVHRQSGFPGNQDEDSIAYNDDDYSCEADESRQDAHCSAHGSAIVIGGVASCECETGYAGATCDVCAPGYSLDGDLCVRDKGDGKLPLTIEGIEQSVEAGGRTTFEAKDERGRAVRARWELVAADATTHSAATETAVGCLFVPGDEQNCGSTAVGSLVGFEAPDEMPVEGAVVMVQLNIDPLDSPSYGATTQSIVLTGAGGIPIDGLGDAAMAPYLDALSRFMRQRCVGAATLGVARYGTPLALYGLGRYIDQASENWHDYCQDDDEPLKNPVDRSVPFMIGSISKPVTFAITRRAIKESLQANDTDLAIVYASPGRIVTAQRNSGASDQIKVAVWSVSEAGAVAPLSQTIVDLGLWKQARDFSLVRLANGTIVLAAADSEKNVHLRAWGLKPDGTLNLQIADDLATSYVIDVEATALANSGTGTGRFALMARGSNGNGQLYIYSISRGSSFVWEGAQFFDDAHMRAVELADVSDATHSRLVMAVMDGDGELLLHAYEIGDDGTPSLVGTESAGITLDMALVGVKPSRVVTAVRTQAGNLKLISWAVAANGNLDREEDANGDAIEDVAAVRLSDTRIGVAVQLSANNEMRMSTWDVLLNDGSFSFKDENDQAGKVSAMDMTAMSHLQMVTAVRDSENKLRNVAWGVSSPGFITRQGTAVGTAVPDSSWSDATVESMYLLGYDLPTLLLPTSLQKILDRQSPPPKIFEDISSDDENDPACADLTSLADPQWQEVQLKHVFSHGTGLSRSAPDYVTQIVKYLPELRGWNGLGDVQAAEQQLRNEFGDNAVDDGKALLDYEAGDPPIYVVPRPGLRDALTAVAGRCLRYPLGEYHYSNTTAVFALQIVEHLTGRSYAAPDGYPDEHAGSALDIYFERAVGLETAADEGIFNYQNILGLNNYTQPGPLPRDWSSDQGTYYPNFWERKRPHCVWSGGACDFQDWMDASRKRLDWSFLPFKVPFQHRGAAAVSGGTGGLAMEPAYFLTFMRQTFIGGYDADPFIGQDRNNNWGQKFQHNGSTGGGYAFAMQYGGDTAPARFSIPRQRVTPYLPIISEDTFGATESAFFVADGLLNTVKMYDVDGSLLGTTDVEFGGQQDAIAVGSSVSFKAPTVVYIADHISGKVYAHNPGGFLITEYDFDAGFAAGDSMAVGNADVTDVYDEVVIAHGATGEVEIYSSAGDLLDTIDVNFSAGNKIAVGDANDNGFPELYVTRANTGVVSVYNIATKSNVLNVAANFSPGSGLAVGNVVGSSNNKDELIIGRADNGQLQIYNYSLGDDEFQLYSSFSIGYSSADSLAVNDRGIGSSMNEIAISNDAEGFALIIQAKKNSDGDFVFFLEGAFGAFEPGSGSQVGAGFLQGQGDYTCSLPTGFAQAVPDGVDIIVALNQSNDSQCASIFTDEDGDGEDDVNDCSSYYYELSEVMKFATCRVNWSNVVPVPPATAVSELEASLLPGQLTP